MSDELDNADAAGAVTPQRPTGKRSRRRALEATGVDESTDTALEGAESDGSDVGAADTGAVAVKVKPAKKVADKGKSRNPIAFVFTYLQQVVAELRKVIWPNRKQMVSYTTVVLAFLVFMVTLIGLADLGLAKLVLLVFG